MMKKKGMYRYTATDGRIVLSPEPLYEALVQKDRLDLHALPKDVQKNLSILADPLLAHIMTIASDGDLWVPPEAIMNMTQVEMIDCHASIDRNCCLLKDDTLYLRDGSTYKPLAALISEASREDLIGYLWDVALQAALAQIERSSHQPGNPA